MADSNKPSAVPIYISIILFVCFVYGIYDYLTGFEENGCALTYMYEYPQFVRIQLPQNISQKYPRYKLYAYGEGVYTEQLRDGKFNGVPVLFIPGNGGSYKQARSLASVAYRRAVDSRLRTPLNVFTVDLAEDLGAVHGRLLAEQTRFVAACVRAVLRLYGRGPGPPPASVALVGHSMGGVVARGLFALPGFDPASVNVLLLLAAPIAEPPLRVDLAMVSYYGWVESFWAARRNTTLSAVTVVSLSGGDRDVQIRPHQTQHPSSDITAVTVSVPGVWASADHQCIVWCRQLVLVMARALFDLVSADTRQITTDPAAARAVLRHHFVQRTHGKHYRNAFHPATVPLDPAGEWKQYALRQWSHTAARGESGRPTYLMIGLMNNPLYQRATISTVNLPSRDWLVACVASKVDKGVRMCEEGDNLSHLGEQVPSLQGRRRSVSLDLERLHERGYTHVVVIVRPAAEQVTVDCDVSRHSDRQLTADVPAFSSFRAFFSQQLLLAETQAGALSYNVSLKSLTEPWQAVRLYLRPTAACGLSSQSGLSFHVPWGQQTQHVLTSGTTVASVAAKLQFPRPVNLSADVLPYVTAHLDPTCRYSISLQNSFPELWGQMARYFGALLVPAVLSVTLVTLAEQLRAADAGQTLTTHGALLRLTPLKLVMPSQLLTSLLGWSFLSPRLPPADLPQLAARGLSCSVLPFLLYFVSWAVVWLLSLVGWAAVAFIGGLVHRVTGRLVSRAVGGSEAVAEVAVAGAARFPVILSVALSALALSSCGEIALGLGLIVTCVKVFQSYEEVLSGGGRLAALKAYTSVTLALVWLWVTLFHLPCLLVWSRTRSESTQLPEDPSLVAALVLCNCGAVLWRDAAPRLDLAGYRAVAAVVHTAAVAVYLFCLLNVYRAFWLAAAAVLAVAVHQLTAPVREIPAEPDTGAEQEAPEAEQEAPEGEQTQEQEAELQEQDGAAGGDGDSGPEDAADEQPCPADSADSAPAGGPGGDGVRHR
ncbi:GPI inositol-deacylase-like [Amphibalanus amphitrite]|uniref:GPI inositol-deacylase-like n=1 Tax=Amphibalanus amphitrite TaxID=1232801 RepID=UPI001C921484|nr:GPI inositol-deacylase-like [Amphibalanus amphitrite]